MKKFLFPLQFVFLAIFMVIFGMRSEAQVTLAGWTFPAAVTPVTKTYSAECGVSQSTAMIYLDGTNGSSDWVGGGPIMFYNGGVPADGYATCEVTAATKAISLVNQSLNYNDSCIVFKFSTTGFQNIMLSYSTQGTESGFTTQTWAHSTDGVNFVDDTTFTGRNAPPFTTLVVDFSADEELANQTNVYIRLTVSGATTVSGNNRFDNINFTGVSDVASVSQPNFSLSGGNYCSEQSIVITTDTANATIYYTLDGSTPDSLTGILYTTPVALNSTATLSAIAYKDGLAESFIRIATYTFPTQVADIATFKAGTAGEFYKLTGDVTVTFQSGNYLYVQDATAGLLIYSSGLNSYNNGDVLSGGICGIHTVYGGVIELTTPEFENPTATAGAEVLPVTVTMSDLLANWTTYDSKLIQLEAVSFEAGTFGTSLGISQGTDNMACYNQYNTITGVSAPANLANVIGMAVYNNQLSRIAPRYPNDIIEITPAVTINSPANNTIFEETDAISVDITTQFFNYEDGKMIKFELTGTMDTVFYCSDATTLSIIESANLNLPIGNYTLFVSLVDNNYLDLTPAVIDSVSFSITETYIAIEATPTTLDYTTTNESHSITVSAFNLTEDITLTCNNANFALSTTTIPSDAVDYVVDITFVGTQTAYGLLTLTSGTTTTTITLNGIIPIDEVFYGTGFESEEDFIATSTYNNQTIYYSGDTSNLEYQWGTYYGTPSTTSPIFGSQSMQMRWYTSAPANLGYTYTDFDVPNATKVDFYAKNTNSLNVSVSYSTDGGNTYIGDSIIELTSYSDKYTYFISDSGQYAYVRVKFAISLPETTPSGTSRLYLDSVVIFNVPGLAPTIVSTPSFSINEGVYLEPQDVEITCSTRNAHIYYTTDGTTPDSISGTLYTIPVNIINTTTLKAIAYKANMDASNIATATYTFPTEVADIEAFKAANENLGTNTTPYKITGDVTFIYRNGRYIYIQDETAGLLVYDAQNNLITNTYTEGDVISGGIIGTYTVYNGLIEMIPLHDWAASTENTGNITPIVVTAQEMSDNFAEYESKLIRINRITYTDGGTFTTASATSITFTQDGNDVDARNQFKSLDTTIVAGATGDIIGLASIFVNTDGTTLQILPRTNADLLIASEELSVPVFTPAGGTYTQAQQVTLSTTVENAVIYYTIDGTNPTTTSLLYSAPIEVAESMTIKAITYLDGNMSAVATEDYIIETGIADNDESDVQIYPNPVAESLVIQVDNSNYSRVEVINSVGQVVYRNDAPVYPLTISFQNNAAGLYFVRLQNNDTGVIIKKINKL